jgi:hypothetical protein
VKVNLNLKLLKVLTSMLKRIILLMVLVSLSFSSNDKQTMAIIDHVSNVHSKLGEYRFVTVRTIEKIIKIYTIESDSGNIGDTGYIVQQDNKKFFVPKRIQKPWWQLR